MGQLGEQIEGRLGEQLERNFEGNFEEQFTLRNLTNDDILCLYNNCYPHLQFRHTYQVILTLLLILQIYLGRYIHERILISGYIFFLGFMRMSIGFWHTVYIAAYILTVTTMRTIHPHELIKLLKGEPSLNVSLVNSMRRAALDFIAASVIVLAFNKLLYPSSFHDFSNLSGNVYLGDQYINWNEIPTQEFKCLDVKGVGYCYLK